MEQAGDRFDFIALLQPTSPFRDGSHIDAAMQQMRQANALSCVSVCEAASSPYLMMTMDAADRLAPVIPYSGQSLRSQDLPKVYELNGAIYLTTPAALRETRRFVTEDSVGYVMERRDSIDIDTAADYIEAQTILKTQRTQVEGHESTFCGCKVDTAMSLQIRSAVLSLVLMTLPLCLAVIFGLKQFEIWDQVTAYWDAHVSPEELLESASSHALRYTLFYPIFVFSEQIKTQYDTVFSVLVIGMYAGTCWQMISSVEVPTSRADHFQFLIQWHSAYRFCYCFF